MHEYSKDVRRLLEEAGYTFKRKGHGDHAIWWNPRTRHSVPVDSKIKSRHSANETLKQAGLPKAF